MLYDYKSDELVQDVILEDIEILVEDIIEEFYSLRRYGELDIYVPSPIAREIISVLLDEVDELWVHADSHNDLLYKNDNDVLVTIATDGMVFVEEARTKGILTSSDDSSLVYIYDGFSKKDIDTLEENAESILVFGFEEEFEYDTDDECTECCCDKCEYACKENEKNTVTDNNISKENYFVNGKSVSKEEFDKKYTEFEDKYMDNIRDMMLRYCDLMDRFNDYQKMFW